MNLFISCLLFVFAAVGGEEKSLAVLTPPGVVFYAELKDPGTAVENLLSSEFYKALREIPAIRTLEESDQYKKVMALRQSFEGAAQKPAVEAFKILAGGGVAFALKAEPATRKPSFLVLIRSKDPALATRMVQIFVPMFSLSSSETKIERDEDHDSLYFSLKDKFALGCENGLIAFSNSPELLKGCFSNLHNSDNPSLEGKPNFVEARKESAASSLGWAYLDVQGLKSILPRERLGPARLRHPLAALIFGGNWEAFQSASYLSLRLETSAAGVQLRASLPARPASDSPFFVPAGKNSDEFTAPQHTLARLNLSRDWEQFWVDKEKFVEEADLAKMAEFNTNLGILFMEKQFDRDILPELEPQAELIVTRQSYEGLSNPPLIRYPAGALIFQLKHPEKLSENFQLAFQTAVGIGNAQRGKQGSPGLKLGSETVNGISIQFARYSAPAQDDGPVPNYHNLSPAIAVIGNRVILSSSFELARTLVQNYQAQSPKGGEGKDWASDAFWVNASNLSKILRENEESLITNNMLEKMHSREEAKQEVKTLLSLIDLFDGLSVQERISDNRLQWNITLKSK